MFPLIPRFLLGAIVFGEIYFMVLLNYGIVHFNIGIQEFVGAYTVFAFYMYLRVADDFKDYETDKRLFPNNETNGVLFLLVNLSLVVSISNVCHKCRFPV